MIGKKHSIQLSDDYTIEEIKRMVKEKFGSGNYRLIVNGQSIEKETFTALKESIKNGTIIYVCQQMMHGVSNVINIELDKAIIPIDLQDELMMHDVSNVINIELYKAIILIDLQDELRKVSAQQTTSECMICTEEKQCIKFCCSSTVCKECFPNYFVAYGDYKN